MEKTILFNTYTVEEPIPVPSAELPSDFPKFTITGESPYDGDFYLTPHTTKDYTKNYIFVLNKKGEVIRYKKVPNQVYDFKKVYNKLGQVRYTYLDVMSKTEPTPGGVGFFENSELVVLKDGPNNTFIEIDRVRHNKAGEVPEDYPAENHFSLYIDDGHYIIAGYFQPEGSNKYENSIQEIKWNKVMWHLETNDIPELATLSHTTPTGDYAHINAMSIDYDDNYIISFRNIGLVKINKETKEIMWVIGKNRNDFTGIESTQIPFQQHDVRIWKGDGSISVFDNYGHTTNSRICRYYLDQDTKTCLKYIEYITNKDKSAYMGSAQLIDDINSVWDITYGSGWNFGFEEYRFKDNTQLMQLKFNEGHDLYNIYRDYDNLTASFKGDATIIVVDKSELKSEIDRANSLIESSYTSTSWQSMQSVLETSTNVYNNIDSSQEDVNLAKNNLTTAINALVVVEPIPTTYSLSNEVFNGTRYIDTEIQPFQGDGFTVAYKATLDLKNGLANVGDYSTVLHCMHEVSPWRGFTVNATYQGSKSSSIDFNVSSILRRSVMSFMTPSTAPDTYTYYAIITYNKIEKRLFMTVYDENKQKIFDDIASTISTIATGEYETQNMIVGAADMISEFSRNFYGTLYQLNYYDAFYENDDRTNIINTILSV